MAAAVNFAGSNRALVAPVGHEEHISTLNVFANGKVCVSKWRLTPDELREVNTTGCVWLAVVMGSTQPPVLVGCESEVRRAVADYGAVWRREEGST